MENDGCAKMLIISIIILVVFALVAGAMLAYNGSAAAKTSAEASAYVRTSAADVDNLIRRQQAQIDNMNERLLLAENTAIALNNVEAIGQNSKAAADNSWLNGIFIAILVVIALGQCGLIVLLGMRSERRLGHLEEVLIKREAE